MSALDALNAAEFEAALIGGVLNYPQAVGAVLEAELDGKHFLDPALGTLWTRVRDISLRGDVVDIRTVIQGGAEVLGGPGTTLQELQAHLLTIAITPARFRQYARLIKACWALRAIVAQADDVKARATSVDAMQLVNEVLAEIDAVRDVTLDRRGGGRGSLSKIVGTLATSARAMASGSVPRPPATGLSDLDRYLPMKGLAAGSLIILAGRTGMGKTMVASSISSKVSAAGHGVCFYSLEVPAAEIAARIACERIGGKAPAYGDVLAGLVTEDDLAQIEWEQEHFAKFPFYLDDTPAMGMADIMVSARREAARFERAGQSLRLIVVDHAQIVKASSRYSGNRVNELGEVANAAKVMAKQLGCAVVLCSQLNRGLEGRDDKRPTLADLRASGEVEEAADAVLMIYREAYYVQKSTKYRENDVETHQHFARVKNMVEIGVEKSRQGSTGRATLWCDPARSIVSNLYRGQA
jgi:replicative DNA helicase